ncbi:MULTISPECIES: hypothetical protein [Crocosphaera]|nr:MULTISPECIES: hypothetical protein [Crocosphaera]NQZ64703.1 hypothetical protein [Crocosphaera sp.]
MKYIKQITLIAFLWLLLTNAGDLGVLDTQLRLQMANAWWTGKEEVQITPNMNRKIRGDIRFGVIGANEKRYIAYEQGQSLLMLPGDWIGTQLSKVFPILEEEEWRELMVSFLIFIPINIAVVVSGYWLLNLFDFPDKVAAISSLLLLLATTVLHHAQVHQQNNQILALIIVGYAGVLGFIKTQKYPLLFWSGLALGGTILIRITCILHVFTVGCFLLGCLLYQTKNIQKIIKDISIWLVGLVPFTFLGRLFDIIRYGSFFASGKRVEKLQLATDPMWEGLPQLDPNYPLVNSPHVGILGPFISPAKSIFLYDPLVLPCLVAGIAYWRRFHPYLQWYLITIGLNFSLHLVAYSRFFFWHGDHAWAARYHVTSLHLFLLPLIAVLIKEIPSLSNLKKNLVKAAITIALIVQLASVAMPLNLEIFQEVNAFPGSQYQLRLLKRVINIACYVNPSITKYCIPNYPEKEKLVSQWNRFNFFPFVLQEKISNLWLNRLIFVLWFLILVSSIVVTYRFLIG